MEEGERPVPTSTRTRTSNMDVSSVQSTAPDETQRPALHQAGGIAPSEQPAEPVSLQTLRSWAMSMFCGGRDNLVQCAGEPFVETITTALICSIKAVVTALFKRQAGAAAFAGRSARPSRGQPRRRRASGIRGASRRQAGRLVGRQGEGDARQGEGGSAAEEEGPAEEEGRRARARPREQVQEV